MTYALGIDIGTTFTAAALWRGGRAEVAPLGNRSNTVPSVLFLRQDGRMLVGEAAEARSVGEPRRVAREFKRRIGDTVPVLLGDDAISAQALLAEMIRWVAAEVTEREGAPPAQVALTCPATWEEYKRARLTEAAGLAGLTEVSLLTEPSAAATAYASNERLEAGAIVGVYDLGGGTFDATVLRKTVDGFELVGQPAGDEHLGGVDFDQVVLDHVRSALGVDWAALDGSDPDVLAGLARLRADAVAAKELLSSDLDATVSVILPGLTRQVRVTRAEFEVAIRDPLRQTIATFRRALDSAGVEPEHLHAVLLVGGSSRIPLIAELITRELGVPVAVDAHPKFAVCVGAAITAGSRLEGAMLLPGPSGVEEGADRGDGEGSATEPPRADLRLPRRVSPRAVIAAGLVLLAVAAAGVLALQRGRGDEGGQARASDPPTLAASAGAPAAGPAGTDPPFEVKVNFQSRDAEPVEGYLVDFGEPFGPRAGRNQGEGLQYGWVDPVNGQPLDLIAHGREREDYPEVEPLRRTLMHMAGWNPGTQQVEPGSWEIALPSGPYLVTVGVGDVARNSIHSVWAEDVAVIDRFVDHGDCEAAAPEPTGCPGEPPEPFEENTARVVVTDGQLTLSERNGQNTKISYVAIAAAE